MVASLERRGWKLTALGIPAKHSGDLRFAEKSNGFCAAAEHFAQNITIYLLPDDRDEMLRDEHPVVGGRGMTPTLARGLIQGIQRAERGSHESLSRSCSAAAVACLTASRACSRTSLVPRASVDR